MERTPRTRNDLGTNGFPCLDESEPVTSDLVTIGCNEIGVMMRSNDSNEYVDLIDDNFSILLIEDEDLQLLSVRIRSAIRIS